MAGGLNRLADKAKDLFNKRGGMGAAKADAQELKDIATGQGSMSDKAKAAADALKDPGAKGPDRPDGPGARDRDRRSQERR